MKILGAISISVRFGENAGFRECVSKRIVKVIRNDDLLRIDHRRDIPVAVHVVAGRLTAGRNRSRQQAADTTCALETPA